LVNLLESDDIYRRPGRPDDGDDASQVLYPEYLTSDDRSADIARHLVHWLTHPAEYLDRVSRLVALRERVGGEGASRRGAEYILQTLEKRFAPEVPTANDTLRARKTPWAA
jgi:lipid-A-disaccharide synthase